MTAQLSREELEILAFNGETHTERALARMLLAGMDSEPVAWVMADDLKDTAIISTPAYPSLDDAKDMTIGEIVPLYAAPPAPVAVPDVARQSAIESLMKHPESYFGKMTARQIAECLSVAPKPVAVPDALEQFALFMAEEAIKSGEDQSGWRGKASNAAHEYALACRAAMQAEPVSAATGWIKCSERMPDETQPVITAANGGVVQRTVYQFCDGVWSDWYDQYDHVKADAFTHWMPLPAAPEQEV